MQRAPPKAEASGGAFCPAGKLPLPDGFSKFLFLTAANGQYNSSMNRFCRKLKVLLLYSVLAVVIAVGCFAAYPALTSRAEHGSAGYSGILRVWQIDSFEGGRGSRASFLNRAARIFEEKNEGTLILVTAHSVQSAANAVAEGNIPDMVSYGVGAEFAGDIALPLDGYDFSYAQVGGKTHAYPWCRGGYFLFTAEGDFSDVSAENTVISQGGSLPEIAAYCAGMTGDFEFESSVSAYVSLINGKYEYMLGTQRDVYRFTTRQFSFRAKPLEGFSDLWQYISVCTDDAKKYNTCLAFLDCLLSDEVQGMLPQIGMMSEERSVYDSSVPAMQDGEAAHPLRSVNAFLSASSLEDLRASARLALNGDKIGAKNLENYLL